METEVQVERSRASLIRDSDRFLGRMLRCHPERAVTPANPLREPVVVEKIIENVAPEPIPIPTPINIMYSKIKRPSVARILEVVSDFYEISITEILSAQRCAAIIRPRQVAMYLACELTLNSLPVIGKHMGRDHTTIMSGRDRIKDRLPRDCRLRDDLDVLRLKLKGEAREAAA